MNEFLKITVPAHKKFVQLAKQYKTKIYFFLLAEVVVMDLLIELKCSKIHSNIN